MSLTYIHSFLETNNIQPGDVLVVENLELGLNNHFIPFLGYDEDDYPYLAADTDYGYRYLNSWELQQFVRMLKPTRIRRFQGSKKQREKLIDRVWRELNEDTFNLVINWNEIKSATTADKSGGGNVAGGIAAGLAVLGLGLLLWGLLDDE